MAFLAKRVFAQTAKAVQRGIRFSPIQQIRPITITPQDRFDSQLDDEVYDKLMPIISEYRAQNQDEDVPVIVPADPEQIMRDLNGPLLPEQPVQFGEIEQQVRDILKYSPRTVKPTFLDKLPSGTDSITQFATLLLGVINSSSYTFKTSPAFTIVEDIVISSLCEMFFKCSKSPYGGVFVPGGSYTNLLAMKLARDAYFPSIKTQGMAALDEIPIAFTSEESHYSVATSGFTLGLGLENVHKLESNANGTINIEKARQTIKEVFEGSSQSKKRPFMISATAGTTVLGAYDDIRALYDLCQEYGMWLHVDGCWGGAVAFGRDQDSTMAQLVDGIELADSIAFDSHKLLSTGLVCSCLLVRDESYLFDSCQPDAKYLFHGDYRLNIGCKTLTCGRQTDALKLYLSWLYHGKEGLYQRVNTAMSNGQYLANIVKYSDDFLLVTHPQYANVCFWYIGNLDQAERDQLQAWKEQDYPQDFISEALYDKLDNNTKTMLSAMRDSGEAMVDFSPLKHLPSFVRLITGNFMLTKSGVDDVVDLMRKHASDTLFNSELPKTRT